MEDSFTRWPFPVLVLGLAALVISLGTAAFASAATASTPVMLHYSYSFSGLVSNDICSFPVTIDGAVAIDEQQFFDRTGARTAIDRHSVEQDTFSANGKSLTGLPFTYNFFHPFDANGNSTDAYLDGGLEKVRLPDGSLFIAAGRVDLTGNQPDFIVSPDNGATVNLAGFCAALA